MNQQIMQGGGYPFIVGYSQPLYDYQLLPAGAPQEVTFFTQGIQGRSYADTNLETAGQMPGDRESMIIGASLVCTMFGLANADVDSAIQDANTMQMFAALEFRINNNVAFRVPGPEIFAQAGVTGQLGGTIDVGFVQPGLPGSRGWLITSPSQYITVPANASIEGRLIWSVAAPQVVAERRIGLLLHGPQGFVAGRS
jgi:hypothetical protein